MSSDNFQVNFLSCNVNEKTEKKDGLTYLPWSYAWSEVLKAFPDASYNIKWIDNKPYFYDETLGYMVFVSVTINSITRDMQLPVMDSKNKAMKSEPYKYTTKYGEKTVEAATMFDINTAIMRCLVKAIAMFGLGLYIYAGEDVPEQKPILCEECNQEIVQTPNKSVDQIAEGTKKETGKCLCLNCYKERRKKSKEIAETTESKVGEHEHQI